MPGARHVREARLCAAHRAGEVAAELFVVENGLLKARCRRMLEEAGTHAHTSERAVLGKRHKKLDIGIAGQRLQRLDHRITL